MSHQQKQPWATWIISWIIAVGFTGGLAGLGAAFSLVGISERLGRVEERLEMNLEMKTQKPPEGLMTPAD